MLTAKTLEADKVTDRDMFNYITQQMLKQGVKSQEQWYDEEADMVEDGDSCQYFGYDFRTDTNLRCAVGWIMNQQVLENYQRDNEVELEGNGITSVEPLEVVILSNENWEFTKESWVMLSIMQRIHDNMEPHEWKDVFQNMSYMFNSDGKFCPNHIIKDGNGDGLSELKLYNDEQEESSHFIDFEELGISFKIPSHNGNVVTRIFDGIKSGNMSCFDPKAIGLNILDAENQQTADVSAMNFLDIVDATRENKKREEVIPVAGE
ncbi:MAG: hypothetical protein O3A49_04535 [Candidatus Marinimicrobia bacterium]|nr:hypothetical protein [Candidatus Neomarinimicrobiota bacterium]